MTLLQDKASLMIWDLHLNLFWMIQNVMYEAAGNTLSVNSQTQIIRHRLRDTQQFHHSTLHYCCNLEALLSAVKLREGKRWTGSNNGIFIYSVSHDTCLCRNKLNPYTFSTGKTRHCYMFSIAVSVHVAKSSRKFPKQTYLCPIQSDQRLVVCHNSLQRFAANLS